MARDGLGTLHFASVSKGCKFEAGWALPRSKELGDGH